MKWSSWLCKLGNFTWIIFIIANYWTQRSRKFKKFRKLVDTLNFLVNSVSHKNIIFLSLCVLRMLLYTKKEIKKTAELPIDITTRVNELSVRAKRCPAAANRGKQPPAAAEQMERAPAASPLSSGCQQLHSWAHTHTAQVEGITVVTAKRNSRSCTHTHTHTQHSVKERESKKENCSWTTLKIARFFFCCSCEKCQHEGKRILKCNQVFASF